MANYDINKIFHIQRNELPPKKGRILISEPFTNDSVFKRSVVLLTQYSKEKGSIGFILNKEIQIEQINGEIMNLFKNKNYKFFIGGPVEIERLFYIHNLPPEKLSGSKKIKENIYYDGDLEQLLELIENNIISPNNIKFFLGYSGWAPMQLEQELENNYWLVKNITPQEIMQNDPFMWSNQIKQLEKKYQIWTKIPEDPTLN